jgi:hypothetical protein
MFSSKTLGSFIYLTDRIHATSYRKLSFMVYNGKTSFLLIYAQHYSLEVYLYEALSFILLGGIVLFYSHFIVCGISIGLIQVQLAMG